MQDTLHKLAWQELHISLVCPGPKRNSNSINVCILILQLVETCSYSKGSVAFIEEREREILKLYSHYCERTAFAQVHVVYNAGFDWSCKPAIRASNTFFEEKNSNYTS